MECSGVITVEILIQAFSEAGEAAPALFHTADAPQLLPGGN